MFNQGQDQLLTLPNGVQSHLADNKDDAAYLQLVQHGVAFAYVDTKHKYGKGAEDQCFRNTMALVMKHSELVYVEGFARPHKLSPVYQHAWAVTREGIIVDTTWTPTTKVIKATTKQLKLDWTLAREYVGVPFKRDYVAKFLQLKLPTISIMLNESFPEFDSQVKDEFYEQGVWDSMIVKQEVISNA